MGTKKYGFLASVLSTSVLLLLLFFSTVSLVLAPKIISWPTGTIEVTQGGTFTLQHKFEWDEAGAGFYNVVLYWWYNGQDDWHFTIDNYRAYFENGDPIECTKSEIDNGDLLSILLRNTVADARDGVFYVDLRLRARGPLGTDHAVTDNHPILYTKLRCNETSTKEAAPGPVTIKVLGIGVEVHISPENQSGFRGWTLTYTVTVKNTSSVPDNYALTVSDNENWGTLEDNLLEVPAFENRTTTLHVTIPDNATPCTQDNIRVRATLVENENIWAEDKCIAHVIGPVVSISPENQSGFRGWTLTYTVTVKNTSSVPDNYALIVSDSENWDLTLDDNRFDNVQGWENRTTTLHVTIPDNAIPCTQDNICVIATSMENAEVSAENKCIAHLARVTFEVSISPSFQSRLPGENLAYTVTVKTTTTDNVDFKDNYVLTASDNENWAPTLDNNQFENVTQGENRQTTLRVTVPLENAPPCTRDNITVTVRSQADNRENRLGSCIAHSLAVDISITPENNARPGGSTAFTVKIWSTSTIPENDNFKLIVSDNSSWNPTVSPSENIGVSSVENGTATLTVTIPENATPCTRDNITVTVISQADDNVRDNESCIAHASYGISVSILPLPPLYGEGDRGENLTYTVTVRNTGTIVDNYSLTENDNAVPSWGPTLDNHSFVNVPPGESRETTLRVTVPWLYHYPPGILDNIIIKVTLAENVNIWAENSCIARSKPPVAKIYPTDDAYVRKNAPDNNYGDDYMYVGRIDNDAVRSFLKFDLSAIPAGSAVENARLYLKTADNPPGGVYGGGENVRCHRVDNDNWYEGTITWNNAPWSSVGGVLDSKPVNAHLTQYSWDVTSFVAGEFGGNNRASFCMVGAGENIPPDHYARFYTREKIDPVQSYLLVDYTPGPYSMLVSISPSPPYFKSGRDNISYLVMVQNVGYEDSGYRLENVDVLGWPKRFDNNQFDNIPPGENRTTTLWVTISRSITTCTWDEITVKAISLENASVIGIARCVAHAARMGALFNISISPLENSARPGKNTTFTVTVTNIDTFPDNYALVVSDNENWGPTLSAQWVWLENGASENLVLRVRIPDNSTVGTRDNIRIRVTSLADNTVWGESWCVAKTATYFRRVGVSISPLENSARPGENLTFTVTVSNTGQVRDNYILTINDNAVPSWGPTLSAQWVWLENGASENLMLRVRIPENAENCTRDKITVTATSRENENVTDNASCIAHALVSGPPLPEHGVQVSISPENQTGRPGENLAFTVTVKNTGENVDTYDLTVSDDAGWGAWLDENLLTILAGENTTVIVSVTVPSDAIEGDSTMITVTATSRGDSTKSDSATCTAIAGEKKSEGLLILPIAVGAAAVAGAAVALLLKKGIIRLPPPRKVGKRMIERQPISPIVEEGKLPAGIEELKLGESIKIWIPKGDVEAAKTAKNLLDVYIGKFKKKRE